LEDKLDEVVSLLRTQPAAPVSMSPDDQLVLTPESSVFTQRLSYNPENHDRLTPEQLVDFRTTYLHLFPFVYLSENLTTDDLHVRYPLLCHAIRTVLTKAVTQQSRLSKQLREQLASRIIVQGERSIDVLLSLIMCIAW
jgi:hypothetical protein